MLLIEDNQVNAKLIKQLLANSDSSSLARGLSFDVSWADRLYQGKEGLAQGQFDVILLDLMLPDSSGISSLIEIKEQAPKVPVIYWLWRKFHQFP